MIAVEKEFSAVQENILLSQQPPEFPATLTEVSSGGSETIMVVEDEPLVRRMIADILRTLGYRVLEAAGALQAQHLLVAKEEIHLLITDFSMPRANGLALARWLQGKFPDLKVLITTGSLWELANQIGDQDHVAVLPKPFDGVQLGRMVRLILSGSRV